MLLKLQLLFAWPAIIIYMHADTCVFVHACMYFRTWLKIPRGVVFDFLKAKLMSVHTTQKTPRHKGAEILSLPLYLVDNEDERVD